MKLFLLVFILSISAFQAIKSQDNVHFLEQHETFERPTDYFNRHFEIYCYRGKPKYLIHLWQSVILQLKHPSSDGYEQYDGPTPEAVLAEFEAKRFSWTLNLISYKQNQIQLDPFNTSCVGIESQKGYSVALNVIRIDYWKVLYLIFGISLFISAEKLSRNAMFYYICGVSFGVCLSFLILIYFISKLFPRKPMMYGVAACGWSVGLYLLQLLWSNMRMIVSTYKMYLLYYALVTGCVSFVVCYRWGPVENQRTLNLIRWSLQVFALASIYCSTQFQEAAMGQIVALLLVHNVPPNWLSKPQKYWKKRFPPKVKLITNEEYYQQGAQETEKALSELRNYCSSPDCNQWDMALKLKDVKRFASFIEGNSHLSDSELLEHEISVQASDLTDDESNVSDEDDFSRSSHVRSNWSRRQD